MRFYFTLHPGDLMRGRILEGAPVMLVASAFWDERRRRFKIHRPPADHIGPLSIDSGGFTAAVRWGQYPWTPEQYVDWLRAETRDMPAAFVAAMDYACERDVCREALATNRERIAATHAHERQLRELAPDLPWLGVLQGNTLAERSLDVARRHELGLVTEYLGIGSICRRPAREAAAVLRFYRDLLPGARFHAFGMDCRALDYDDAAALAVESWDSYAWCWPRGKKSERPTFLHRVEGETRTTFTRRLAESYQASAIAPRLGRVRQLPFELRA